MKKIKKKVRLAMDVSTLHDEHEEPWVNAWQVKNGSYLPDLSAFSTRHYVDVIVEVAVENPVDGETLVGEVVDGPD